MQVPGRLVVPTLRRIPFAASRGCEAVNAQNIPDERTQRLLTREGRVAIAMPTISPVDQSLTDKLFSMQSGMHARPREVLCMKTLARDVHALTRNCATTCVLAVANDRRVP